MLPKREGFEEEDEEVVCDPAFLDAIKLAVGPVEGKQMRCVYLFSYPLFMYQERVLICNLSLCMQICAFTLRKK